MPKKGLRKGFSTGSAATAAIVAATRALLGNPPNSCVSIKVPIGVYIPIPVTLHRQSKYYWCGEVIKDGGDDPDITHGALVRASVALVRKELNSSRIWLDAGEGIGVVTKPGLPVPPGEPAINPVPRQMIVENVFSSIRTLLEKVPFCPPLSNLPPWDKNRRILLALPGSLGFDFHVVLTIPEGKALAKRTLNPRLGIVDGLSILGTSGLVKPFSHEAYEETIDYALRFAKTNGCSTVVLTTGGKSEQYARRLLPDLPDAAFIQIADFFGFAVKKAQEYGFIEVVHAVFFGKAVKMAMGFSYTHAREGLIDMSELARKAGLRGEIAKAVSNANTARQVLEMLKGRACFEAIQSISREALYASVRFASQIPARRLILFDYDGTILFDESF
ncbi:MAG: cobalt-precorrin-5B (C(1))-methyltransferase CbiD [Thermodesulforhabdaceae bacterium]